MDMKNKICPECKTANEAEYSYCKNCGTALPELKKEENIPPYCEVEAEEIVCPNCKTINLSSFNFCKTCGAPLSPKARHSFDCEPSEVDGIPAEDLKLFVGRNGDRIVNKWAGGNRRSMFCWPAALLTAVFGFAGAAFWFLYRRMYKKGILLLIAALLLFSLRIFTLISAVEDVGSVLINTEEFGIIAQKYQQDYNYADFVNGINSLLNSHPDVMQKVFKTNAFLNGINSLEFIGAILLGMFSLGAYKSFALSKLRTFTQKPTETELSLSGGTSAGALAIGILIYVMLTASILVLSALGIILM